MQLRSADEGSTIFYKVRALVLEREEGMLTGCSVSTVEIKHPRTTSLPLGSSHVWPDFRNDLQASNIVVFLYNPCTYHTPTTVLSLKKRKS